MSQQIIPSSNGRHNGETLDASRQPHLKLVRPPRDVLLYDLLTEEAQDEYLEAACLVCDDKRSLEASAHLPQSEYGHAQRLVAAHGRNMMYVPNVGRFAWDGRRWRPDHAGQWMRWAKDVASRYASGDPPPDVHPKQLAGIRKQVESLSGLNAMLSLAETEEGIFADASQLDADPWLLNVANGTVDLRSGELRKPRRRDRITKVVDVSYDAEATCLTFDKFLSQIQPDPDMRAYLQRQAGYAASGSINEQQLVIAWGSGGNGKSTLLDLLLHVFGPYAGTAPDSLLTTKTFAEHPAEFADLQGKRLVVASETEEDAKLRVALVKRLTGDENIKARFMRGNYFEFKRTHKLWLQTNPKPQVGEGGNAIWRRLRLVPFQTRIAAEDIHMLDKLKAEAPGVLAWMVRGCIDWQRGGMRTPAAVTAATQKYRVESDRLAGFKDQLVFGDAVRVTRAELLDEYLRWAKRAGESNPLTRNALYERVRNFSGVADDSWKAGGQKVLGFVGVGLAWANGGVADYPEAMG